MVEFVKQLLNGLAEITLVPIKTRELRIVFPVGQLEYSKQTTDGSSEEILLLPALHLQPFSEQLYPLYEHILSNIGGLLPRSVLSPHALFQQLKQLAGVSGIV